MAGAEGDAARGGETALEVEGGLLCQLLRSPDYNLFPRSAVFESNFIQVVSLGGKVLPGLGDLPPTQLREPHGKPGIRVGVGTPRLRWGQCRTQQG